MRIALDIARAIFISWEFAAVLCASGLLLSYPAAPAFIGKKLLTDATLLTWLFALPGAAALWGAKQAKEILAPAAPAQNAYLRSWPDYWRIKLRVFTGMAWIGAAFLTAVVMRLVGDDFSQTLIG